MWTVTALHFWFATDARSPLVSTSWGIACFACPRVLPPLREHIIPASKPRANKAALAAGLDALVTGASLRGGESFASWAASSLSRLPSSSALSDSSCANRARIAAISRSRSASSRRSGTLSLLSRPSLLSRSINFPFFSCRARIEPRRCSKSFWFSFYSQRLKIEKQRHVVIIASRVATFDFSLDLATYTAGAALL
jgi:hypothetical protein